MPSPKANINDHQLDLEVWSKFKPQERANDFEYNLLLYKYKTFYNEVKNFLELHSNCSISKGLINTTQPQNDVSQSASTNLPPTVNNNIANNRLMINDHQISSTNKKPYFQHQNSVPVITNNNKCFLDRAPLIKQTSFHQTSPHHENPQHQDNNNSTPNQHYNSSYNLNSIPSGNTVGISNKPEIKRRGHVSANNSNNSKFLLSKSSERLDTIINNNNNKTINDNDHTSLTCSFKNRDLNTFQTPTSSNVTIKTTAGPVGRDSKYSQDDDNIYDAVSPDDDNQLIDSKSNVNVASSIHNINRLSLPQKTKFETSKSSLGLGSTINTELSSRDRACENKLICKSTPLRNSNDETIEPITNNRSGSFDSSLILDASNSSTSLSILNTNNSKNFNSNYNNNRKFSDEYANYVNIDFFLKRSQSPSCDGLDEDISNENEGEDENDEDDDADNSSDNNGDDTDDPDTAQLSHSISSDQISEDLLKNMSPREIARKLSSVGTNNNNNRHYHNINNDNNNNSSSASITPSSSGDFLDDSKATNSSSFVANHQLSPNSISIGNNSIKLGSFFATNNNNISLGSDCSNYRINQTSINNSQNESNAKNHSLSKTQPSLGLIQENNKNICISPTSSTSLEKSSNSYGNNNDNNNTARLLDKNGNALIEARNTMRSFLSDLNLSPVDDVFEDKAQRRIVKESFAVEYCGRRKLRHLFLFNDVIVCAKYQASSKQKFTFDVKWYLNLSGVSILDMSDATNQLKYDKEAIENQILAIRTNLMLLRGQMQHIKRSKHKQPSKVIKKLKKKRTELEAELVLLLPHLPLIIKHINGKKYSFFLSSNFDRNQWIESIKFLQSQLPKVTKSSTLSNPSSSELQAWIQTCRKNLNPSLGTFLLRSNCDDDLLYGDLNLNLISLDNITKAGNYYLCFEVDSYGHFSQKASSTIMKVEQQDHKLNDEYVFPLDGSHTLRILLYEELNQNSKPSVIGKALIELSRTWLSDKPAEKVILFNSNCSLVTKLSFSSSELLSMRVPHAKLCPTFGLDITQVCKKEKTNVPLIIQLCVHEVERRGMREVGIYRMSGTSTDIQRLKKAFETNPYVAELLLRDIDINSVTGFLKTYLRELPEGLFSNKLYPKFVAAFNRPQTETLERTEKMLELFHKIPITNQHTIIYLVEHLVKIYKFENYNKMSLTNLATVLGPNILRSPTESSSSTSASSGSTSVDPFTAVVIGSMSQAGILYFFLNRKFSNLPLTELDSSERARKSNTSKNNR